jgi:hypothetical protein
MGQQRARPFRLMTARQLAFHHQVGPARPWELYRSGTTRFTPPVAIDLYDSMLRSIDQPASCTDFAIQLLAKWKQAEMTSPVRRCLRQLLRAHVCDVDLHVMPHETVRHHVEETTPVGAQQVPSIISQNERPFKEKRDYRAEARDVSR